MYIAACFLESTPNLTFDALQNNLIAEYEKRQIKQTMGSGSLRSDSTIQTYAFHGQAQFSGRAKQCIWTFQEGVQEGNGFMER